MRKSFFSKAIVAVGVMASALALSSVAVFAADYGEVNLSVETAVNATYDNASVSATTWSASGSNKTRTVTWSTPKAKTGVSDLDGNTLLGLAFAKSSGAAPKYDSSNALKLNNANTISVPVTSGASGTITVTGNGNQATRYLYLNNNSNKSIAMNGNGASLEYASTDITNGYLIFTVNDSENKGYKILGITLTETVSGSTEPAVSLNSQEETITVGEEVTLTANSYNFTSPVYSWSTGTAIASVTPNSTDSTKAVVRGLTAGTLDVTVTVTEENDSTISKTSTCTVTVVEPIAVSEVNVSLADSSIYVGKTTNASYTVNSDANGDTSVTWSSADEDVATVDPTTGKITAVAAGTTTIIATAKNGVTGSAEIEVKAAPTVFPANDTIVWEIKAYNANEDMGNGMTAKVDYTYSKDADAQVFTDGTNDYSYSHSTMAGGSNGEQLVFNPTSNGTLTVLAKINADKNGSMFGVSVEKASATRYMIFKINVTSGETYSLNFSGTKPPIYYLGFTPIATETTASKVSSIASQNITNATGITVDALYTEDESAGYLIFAFVNDNALAAVNSLSYNGNDITTLYNTIAFDDGSEYSKEGSLLYGFVTEKGETTSISGTFE